MSTQRINITPLQRFWMLLKPDQKDIRNVYVYSIFNGLVSLSLPLGIQAIINMIQGGQVNTSWIILVALVVLGVAVSGMLQIWQLRITENLQQRIFTRAAFEFAYRIPRIRLEAMYKHYAPELMNRFFDTISVQKGLSKLLIGFSTALLQVVFGLLLLSMYHSFFIFFSLTMLLLVFAIFRFSGKRGLMTSLNESRHKYEVAHWLEEVARVGNTFKLAGKTDLPLDRTDKHVKDYLEARESHFKVLVSQYSLMIIFKVLVATGLLAIGGILVMEQHMNIGQFVAAEIIILSVMAAVEKLILSLETIYDVLTSLEKIGQVTDMELEQDDGVDMRDECVEGGGLQVQLRDVGFSYPGQDKKTLDGLNLTMEKGQKWLVTGNNGTGKSTLLQVVAGLFDAQEGTISYNGLPKRNLELSSLRSIIGDSLSQEDLFDGTLLDNITIGRENATFENVKWAVKNLGLEEFVRSCPKGYKTMLGPQTGKLPRSLVNKILLARSIADKPRLLLLEDAFEHMDEPERRKIIDFLTAKENGWTLVAVSSDPYLASRCKHIAIMKEGTVDRVGTFEELKDSGNFKTNSHA